MLDDKGQIIANKPITKKVAKFIIDNFEIKGDTESFNITKADLKRNCLQIRNKNSRNKPDATVVRHVITEQEKTCTATGDKLYYHWPIFKKLAETGYGSIIRASMTNHQICSSHCPYCSVIRRNRADSISLKEAQEFVKKLYFTQAKFNQKNFPEYNKLYKQQTGSDIRLKGLILTGGGQPNLWPHFEKFVEWLANLDIDLGLITNGFPPKINEKIYNNFKWVRLSITPEDVSPHYKNGKFNEQYFPKTIVKNSNIIVGLSYVYGHWTNDDILNRIDLAIKKYGFDYCRMLTDCNLSRHAQLQAHRSLAERLYKLGYINERGKPLSKIFHQLKFHGDAEDAKKIWREGQCFLQSYNVFWDTTGHDERGYSFCYACDSITVLAEETNQGYIFTSERKFNPSKWGTVKNIEVEQLFNRPLRPFFDPRKVCSSCLFMRNNNIVRNLIKRKKYDKIQVNSRLDHLNFP